MTFGFLGLGNMGTAILRGMVAGGYDAGSLYGYDADASVANTAAADVGLHACHSIEELMERADCVVLAVKPQILPRVLPAVRVAKKPGQWFVSIAAGKTLAYFADALGEDVPVVRVMPNLNAKIGASATCLAANEHCTQEQVGKATLLFEAVGTVVPVEERLIPVFSGVAGASPAFTFMYIDALARAGVKHGLPKPLALKAAAAAVAGSARMVLESGHAPGDLVDMVCSPGGTTIEGVGALQDGAFESTVRRAVDAVVEKDKRLGEG